MKKIYFGLLGFFFFTPVHAVLIFKHVVQDKKRVIYFLGDMHDQPEFEKQEKEQTHFFLDVCKKRSTAGKPLTVLIEAAEKSIKFNWDHSGIPKTSFSLIRDLSDYLATLAYKNISLKKIDNRSVSGLAFEFFKPYRMSPLFGSDPQFVQSGYYCNEFNFTFNDLFKEILVIQKALHIFAQSQPKKIASIFKNMLQQSREQCDALQKLIDTKKSMQSSMLAVANRMWFDGIIKTVKCDVIKVKSKNDFIAALNQYYAKTLEPYMRNYPNVKDKTLEENAFALSAIFDQYMQEDLTSETSGNFYDERKSIFMYLLGITNPLVELNIIKHMLLSSNDVLIIAGYTHIDNILIALDIKKENNHDGFLYEPLNCSQLHDIGHDTSDVIRIL